MINLNKRASLVLRAIALLLCFVMLTASFCSCSLAKYISNKKEELAVGVAALNCNVAYTKNSYSGITINLNDPAIYMVIDQFTLENTGEVAFTYNMELVLSASGDAASFTSPLPIAHGSLAAPVHEDGVALRQIRARTANTSEIVDVNFSNVCSGQTYTPGKIYYATSENGRNYTWQTTDALTVTGEIAPGAKVYYRVAYFVDLSEKDESFIMPETSLLYRVYCEQILR